MAAKEKQVALRTGALFSSDGVSKEEAMQIEERMTPLINHAVNVPVLPEKIEGKLISLILGLIINAMVKGFSLEEAEPAK